MESAYLPQIDEIVAQESATPYIFNYTALPLNPIHQLTQPERAKYSVTDDMFPAFARLAGGSSRQHFYYTVIVRVFELSLSLEDPLAFWTDLAWVIDTSPFFDKSDEIEGQVLLHINDMIQRTLAAGRGPMALGQRNPIQVLIGVFYNKIAHSSFAQTFVSLLQKFIEQVQLEHFPEARINVSEYRAISSDQEAIRNYSGGGFSSISSSVSYLENLPMYRILASLFGLNIKVISENGSTQASLAQFDPLDILRSKFLKQEYLSSQSVILVLDERKGWKIIYSWNEKALVEKLNFILQAEAQGEEEVKRQFSDDFLLERVNLNCACCPLIRRALFVSHIRKEIPGFGNEYTVEEYSSKWDSELGRQKKLEC